MSATVLPKDIVDALEMQRDSGSLIPDGPPGN
jgi:hypothetical protein